jgi:hypothetical protein
MNAYWITFEDGTKACSEGANAHDAKLIAEYISNKKSVLVPFQIPYPSPPVLWQFDHPVNGKMPHFCYTPNECKHRTACPHPRACND